MKTRVRVLAKPRLRKERVKRGWSTTQIAAKIGYSHSAYIYVENRRNGMRPYGVEKLTTLLGLEFDDIFEFDGGDEE